jgi:hypothetical protein
VFDNLKKWRLENMCEPSRKYETSYNREKDIWPLLMKVGVCNMILNKIKIFVNLNFL